MSAIGYIRVSTTDQNTDRQLDGITLDKTFTDQTSGKDTNRPQLQACLDYVREDDTLYVHSIDRLARSLQDLQTTVDSLLAKGVTVNFVKESLTFQKHGANDPFAQLLFQVLGSFAEFERNILKERQREGIAKAKAKGVYSHGKGGRKKSVDRDLVKKLHAEELSLRKIAKEAKCSLSSVQRILDGDEPRQK